jgi:hypothetical protein
MPTKSALSGARRAEVTGLGVPEHHGDRSAFQCSSNAALSVSKSGHRVDVD